MRIATKRAAFSLIELIVTVAFMTALLALLLPAIQSARATARKISCANNIRQLAFASQMRHDAHRRFPAGTGNELGRYPFQGWAAALLPFAGESTRYHVVEESFALSSYPFEPATHPQLSAPLPLVSCAEDWRTIEMQYARHSGGLPVGVSAFVGVAGVSARDKSGVLFYDSSVRLADITDGSSQTLLFGERPPSKGTDYGWWYAGVGNGYGELDHHMGTQEKQRSTYGSCIADQMYFQNGVIDDDCSVSHFWSLHVGGANFATADGSVRFFSYGNSNVLNQLATRAEGEVNSFP